MIKKVPVKETLEAECITFVRSRRNDLSSKDLAASQRLDTYL